MRDQNALNAILLQRVLSPDGPPELVAFAASPPVLPRIASFVYLRDGRVASSWIERLRVLEPRDAHEASLTAIPAELRADIPPGMISIAEGPGSQQILYACEGPHAGTLWVKNIDDCAESDNPFEQVFYLSPSIAGLFSLFANPAADPFVGPPVSAPQHPSAPDGPPPPLTDAIGSLCLLEPLEQGYNLPDPAWQNELFERETCSLCLTLKRELDLQRPVRLRRVPRKLFSGIRPLLAMHESVFARVKPWTQEVAVRAIEVGGAVLPDWKCLHYLPASKLETGRGRFAVHRQCPQCREVYRYDHDAHPVVLKRDLDGRQLYLTEFNELLLTPAALAAADFASILPTLKVHDVPIVVDPRSREVLPGDPGWSGEFQSTRVPKVGPEAIRTAYRMYL